MFNITLPSLEGFPLTLEQELHDVVSGPSAPVASAPISVHSLPTAVSSTASSFTFRGQFNGELHVNGKSHRPILDGQHNPSVASGSSPSTEFAVRHTTLGSAALVRLEAQGCTVEASIANTTTTSNHGLGSPSHNTQRQALHGLTVVYDDVNAASSSPRRPLTTTPSAEHDVDTTLLPVRQWPGQQWIPSSGSLTQLAVFGLVSMLLIMGLTSLLQLQSPIFAHLRSTSSLVFFLSGLSTLSPTKQGILDSAKSIHRRQGRPGRRSGLSCMTGTARAPLACC